MARSSASWLLALVLGALAPAMACSVMPNYKNIVERKAVGPVTVHGILVGIKPDRVCNRDVLLLSFEVIRAYGNEAAPGDTMVIHTPASDAVCGVRYPIGTEVVVFSGPGWSCPQSLEILWTDLASYNVVKPSQAEVDSLYGPDAVHPRGRNVGRAFRGSTQAAGSFRHPGKASDELHRTDGRRIIAP